MPGRDSLKTRSQNRHIHVGALPDGSFFYTADLTKLIKSDPKFAPLPNVEPGVKIWSTPKTFVKGQNKAFLRHNSLNILPNRERIHLGLSNRWRQSSYFIGDLLDLGQRNRALYGSQTYFKHVPVKSVRLLPYRVNSPTERLFTHECCIITQHMLQKIFPCWSRPLLLPKDIRVGVRNPWLTQAPGTCPQIVIAPSEVFHTLVRKAPGVIGPGGIPVVPDVRLECQGSSWYLHRILLAKSTVLAGLLHAENQKMQEEIVREQEIRRKRRLDGLSIVPEKPQATADTPKTKLLSQEAVITLKLELQDEFVTPHALAVCLGNLYHKRAQLEASDIPYVMSTAKLLGFNNLLQVCMVVFSQELTPQNVMLYYKIANVHRLDLVRLTCERWLEMHLIPLMIKHSDIKEISIELMHKLIVSPRLFVYSEFAVWQAVTIWMYLKLKDRGSFSPSYKAVEKYFSRQPRNMHFLQREGSEKYSAIFNEIKLHGISENSHMRSIQSMNILPSAKVFKMILDYHTALSTSGDMLTEMTFSWHAVRKGIIISDHPHHYNELYALYGFNFELKAAAGEIDGRYSFYIQRLRPEDNLKFFGPYETGAVSVKRDRKVQYCIQVQYQDKRGFCHTYTSNMLEQKFNIDPPNNTSEILTLDGLIPPVFATYKLFYPPSGNVMS